MRKLFSRARSDDLAPRDQADRPRARSRRPPPARKRSASVGRSRLKCVTVPAARAASSTASGLPPSCSRTSSPRGAAAGELGARHAGEPARRRRRPRPARAPARRSPRPRSRSSSTAPAATSRPSLTIATSSHSRSTSSSWCEEKTTGTPASARSRSTPLITSTPIGSSPENGSSSTSTSGSWTSATPSWTRCWLPSESVSTRSPARSASPSRSIQRSAARLGARRARARAGARSRRAGRARASSGTARAPPACSRSAPACRRVDGLAAPAHRAGVGLEHAEDDPHRGRLAGPVRPDEADIRPPATENAQVVERDQVAEARAQSVQLEHPRSGSRPADSSPASIFRRPHRNFPNVGALYGCRPSGGAAGTRPSLSRLRPARPCPAAARGRAGRRR